MEERIITEIKREPFEEENGLKFEKITYKVKTPRKTFILGDIKGKYRGNFLKFSEEYYNTEFYDFEIYESLVEVKQTSKNIPFDNECNKNRFPREKLPELLKVHVKQSGKYFELGIIEPKICDFKSNKKLHQTEGNEVFGTFTGLITGYVFDYEISYEEKIIQIIDSPILDPNAPNPPNPVICEQNDIKTGRKEEKGNYTRYEYRCKKHNDTVWGKWEKNSIVNNSTQGGIFEGCFTSILGIIGFLLVGSVLISFFPAILYIIGFGILVWLLNITAPFLKWIFRGLLGLYLISLFISIVYNFSDRRSNYLPTPKPIENEKELNPIIEPITDKKPDENIDIDNDRIDSSNDAKKVSNDKMIKHFRIWNDYDDNQYEGTYYLKQSNYLNSGQFKNDLSHRSNLGYDQILYNLEKFDTNNFSSIYNMFDSIGYANKLNKIEFAKMVVSFVQDIPYNLVLQNDCNDTYQSDRFTRDFLSKNKGMCIGNQAFGICTPVEFLYHLKGDCDTRTLLLYSIFSHYNYDVAILSSEKYMHSILGINLPLRGVAFPFRDKKYYFWETTALGAEPGELSNELNNLHFWRISLKTK
ncbi:nucleoside recognition domain-containing protein [Flavobacterium chuncheonense]|uniref:Nucleoside recognition domain-containing protein n=1 Tax=Flavobacterium chuncheonense TaxID=2026653 RepID=A0ABW5YIM0_9FLAO